MNKLVKPRNPKKVILIGNSLGALVALTCAVSFEKEIETVIASPLPDKFDENEKKRFINPNFKKFINGFIKLFFTFFPLEIVLFLVNKFGVINIGLKAAYYKKDHIDSELIDLVRKPVLRRTASNSLRAMCIGMATRKKFKSLLSIEKTKCLKESSFLLIWEGKINSYLCFLAKRLQICIDG